MVRAQLGKDRQTFFGRADTFLSECISNTITPFNHSQGSFKRFVLMCNTYAERQILALLFSYIILRPLFVPLAILWCKMALFKRAWHKVKVLPRPCASGST